MKSVIKGLAVAALIGFSGSAYSMEKGDRDPAFKKDLDDYINYKRLSEATLKAGANLSINGGLDNRNKYITMVRDLKQSTEHHQGNFSFLENNHIESFKGNPWVSHEAAVEMTLSKHLMRRHIYAKPYSIFGFSIGIGGFDRCRASGGTSVLVENPYEYPMLKDIEEKGYWDRNRWCTYPNK